MLNQAAGGSFASGMAEYWWSVLLRGILAIIVGILFLVNPVDSLFASVIVFGAFALVDGVLALIASFRIGGDARWGLILEGVVGIVVAVIAFARPGVTLISILYLIGAWAVIRGVLEIVSAIRLRNEIDNEWWLILGGACSVIFGILIMAQPIIGLATLAFLVGFYAVLFGIILIFLSFRLKGLKG